MKKSLVLAAFAAIGFYGTAAATPACPINGLFMSQTQIYILQFCDDAASDPTKIRFDIYLRAGFDGAGGGFATTKTAPCTHAQVAPLIPDPVKIQTNWCG